MGLIDSVKGLFGTTTEKATEAAAKATEAAKSAAAKAQDSGFTDQAKEAAAKAADAAKSAAEKAKDATADVMDKHGDKVTGAVASAGAFVSDKTGGKLDSVTGKVDDLTGKAVDSLKSDSPAEVVVERVTDAGDTAATKATEVIEDLSNGDS